MKITVLQEVTDWQFNNGFYHVNSANELVAYQPNSSAKLTTFKNPMKGFSKSRRKFNIVKEYEDNTSDPNVIEVKGSNGNVYVIRDGKCSCPGFTYRGKCKHVEAI